jgi:hypothetical protein
LEDQRFFFGEEQNEVAVDDRLRAVPGLVDVFLEKIFFWHFFDV